MLIFQLGWSEHDANNAMVMSSIPVQTIYLRMRLYEPCESLPTQNII